MMKNNGNGWMKGGDCSYRLARETETMLHGTSVVFGGRRWIVRPENEVALLKDRSRKNTALAA